MGIVIGVVACLVALLLIWHNNEKYFASNSAKLNAIAAKVGADVSKL